MKVGYMSVFCDECIYYCFSISLPTKKTMTPSAKKPISTPIALASLYPYGLNKPKYNAAPKQAIPISSNVFPI